MSDKVVTVSATPNLALVKYWGKRRQGEDCDDPALNLPLNSSFGLTLDAGNQLLTKTSVVFSKKFKEDVFYLDGVKMDMDNPELRERFLALNKLRKLAKVDTKVLVVSHNSFPTASGLASSSSGLSAMIFGAAKALDLKISQQQISEITRVGSGSACRSLFGGFVQWNRGTKSDGSDSVSRQVFAKDHWPGLITMIMITSQKKKKVSSRAGMKQTVATSELYKLRPGIAERNVKDIANAVKNRDFETMAKVTIKDAMNMHATMIDTTPPIMYLSDTSREIIYAIEDLNAREKKIVAAYTFDAGPNADIITTEEYKEKVMEAVKDIEGIEKVLVAKLGDGPKVLPNSESLINEKTLEPILTKK